MRHNGTPTETGTPISRALTEIHLDEPGTDLVSDVRHTLFKVLETLQHVHKCLRGAPDTTC
jgi:hypothetical protein